MLDNPLVSIIVPTYNRSKTICRTLDSIFAQTYPNFEILLVDDGSTDNTLELVKKYHDERLIVICYEKNRGVSAAKNTGLNHITGSWFTILDSDDEIVPDALEQMLRIPSERDPSITAVTCNCLDTTTFKNSGKGIEGDQYMDEEALITKCSGEFWGITKSELLEMDRFNENLPGFESILWVKINSRARRYYIDKRLRIFHTGGEDRISKRKENIGTNSSNFRELINENFYFDRIKKFNPRRFKKLCTVAICYLSADNDKNNAKRWLKQLKSFDFYFFISLIVYISPWFVTKWLIKIKNYY
jgi:glycosyltransferase involved in cell wall biosynthesis